MIDLYETSVPHSPVQTAVRTGRTAKIWSSLAVWTDCVKVVRPVHDFRGLQSTAVDCSPICTCLHLLPKIKTSLLGTEVHFSLWRACALRKFSGVCCSYIANAVTTLSDIPPSTLRSSSTLVNLLRIPHLILSKLSWHVHGPRKFLLRHAPTAHRLPLPLR